MKKAIGAAVAAICFSMLYISAYAFNYVHEDDFESKSLAGYSVNAANGASARICSDGTLSDNQILEMNSLDSNQALVEKKFDALSGTAIFDMDFMRASEDGGSVRVMQIYDSDKKNRPFLLTASKTSLVVRIGEKQTPLKVPDYKIGEWIGLRVILDFNTKTYDLYINGKQYCDDNEFFQSAAENAGAVQIQIDSGTGSGVCKVDNFAIYGINNELSDNAILKSESELADYTVGDAAGEYSKTRFLMLKDKLAALRADTRETVSEDTAATVIEELETAISDFKKGRYYSEKEAESETIDVVANEITADFDNTILYTTGDEDIQYVLEPEVKDNFSREYTADTEWEIISSPDGVTIDGNKLTIPLGTQGALQLKVSVEDIYRYFALYLLDYSRPAITEVTASDGKVVITGTLKRNSDNEVLLNISLGNEIYSDVIHEDENGDFKCEFEIPGDILTTDGMLNISGNNVYSLNQSFIYYASDAAEVALARIEKGTDTEIIEALKLFSDYLDVHIETLKENEELYVGMVKKGQPYSSVDKLNDALSEINLIIEIKKATRNDIESIITGGLATLKSNGFNDTGYNSLSEKNKNRFYVNAVGIGGTTLKEICLGLNKVIEQCSSTTSTTSSGGGGGGGGGGGSKSGSASSVVSSGGTKSNVYVVTPVTEPLSEDGNKPEDEETRSNDPIIFADEDNAEWAKDAIHYLRSKGIIEGYNNYIRPNDPMTRGEIAKMLVTAFEIAPDAEITVGDEWWHEYAERGMISGIIQGYDDGKFHGEGLLIRQDMAVLLSRVIDHKAISVYDKEHKKVYNDDGEISDYANSAVYDLQRYGILSGMGENMFAPLSYVTRAQAIMAIYNTIMVER